MESPAAVYRDPEKNVAFLKNAFSNSFDLSVRRLLAEGKPAAAVYLDGMCDEKKIAECVVKPLTGSPGSVFPGRDAQIIEQTAFKGLSIRRTRDLNDAAAALTDGNLLLFTARSDTAFVFGMQGYPKKSVESPAAEQNERGSGESFVDNYKDNVALLRRRLRTPALQAELLTVGKTSPTNVVVCSLKGAADAEMSEKVKRRLAAAGPDALTGSGSLRRCLTAGTEGLFSGVGFTERPDMLAAKLTEGRIGVFADGSPFALIVPYVFTDHFHSIDDYMSGAAYAAFIRILRLACFAVSTALPGLFVAVCDFHPEVLPANVMLDIAAAEAKTPFSLATEALAIHLIYEIVREAGLRMPVAVGHAVSIVGALVVGDAAVTAGLIAAPMLIVVALTAIASAVIPKLHESAALIRFAAILAGGLMGFFGVFLLLGLVLGGMCAVSPFGVPFSAPLSPYVPGAARDAVFRLQRTGAYRRGNETKEMKKG